MKSAWIVWFIVNNNSNNTVAAIDLAVVVAAAVTIAAAAANACGFFRSIARVWEHIIDINYQHYDRKK